jgi:hypothetical protein
MARNKVARELEAISLVLDQNPGISGWELILIKRI